MAGIYASAKGAILSQSLSLLSAGIKAMPLNALYVPDYAAHSTLADVAPGARVVAGAALANKTLVQAGTGYKFDADDVSFFDVPNPSTVSGVLLYLDAGSNGASKLIGYFDYFARLPYAVTSGTVTFNWPVYAIFVSDDDVLSGPQGVGASGLVKDDIGSFTAGYIDRVRGIRGVPISEDDGYPAWGAGATPVFKATGLAPDGSGPGLYAGSYKLKQGTPPGWHDVTNYFFDADAVFDDWSFAINRAIAEANDHGGVVFFPPGTYPIRQPLTPMSEGVHLLGVTDGGSRFPTHCSLLQSYIVGPESLITIGNHGNVSNPSAATIRNGNSSISRLSIQQMVDTANDYKTDGVFDQNKFNTKAFAGIESICTSEFLISHCVIGGFPVSIIHDGSESSVTEYCRFSEFTTGYSEVLTHGVGVWYSRGPTRDRGNGLFQATNINQIEHCVAAGCATNIWFEEGVGLSIKDISFSYGVDAIWIGAGTLNTKIQDCYFESSTYSGSYVRFKGPSGGAAFNVTIDNCQMITQTCDPIRLEMACYQLSVRNTAIGSKPAGYSVTGSGPYLINYSFLNCSQTQAATLGFADSNAAPAGCGISLVDRSRRGGRNYGLAINSPNPAEAMLHGILLDAYIFKIWDSVRDLYLHSSLGPAHHLLEWLCTSTNTANAGGGATAYERHKFFAADASVDLGEIAVPHGCLVEIEASITQWLNIDPTTYASWKIRQRAYRDTTSGNVTLLGPLMDSRTNSTTITAEGHAGTIAALTQPVIKANASNNRVSVTCYSHATIESHVQVKFEALKNVR